jgi:regulator of vacuolar morphogenesis
MPYTLSIPTTSLSNPDSSSTKPFTLYNLTITTPLRTTTLPKRYSDFVTLHSTFTSTVSSATPAPLPAKSWFTRTVSNPALTESRRQGLERYVRAIEDAADPRWRETSAWRAFLGFPPVSTSRRNSTTNVTAENGESKQQDKMDAATWLTLHAQLKSHLQDARSALARREDKTVDAKTQHEASAAAKRSLVKSNTLIVRLEDALKKGVEGVGEGELRRRRDLVSRARKEREGLEVVLNAWVIRARSPVSVPPTAGANGPEGRKGELFRGAIVKPSSLGSSPGKKSSMPGAFPVSGGRRVLGGPAKETDRTRDKDNQEVLQLQKQIMEDQDMDVEQLTTAVRRLKELGVGINEELVEQQEMLDMLDQDVDRYVMLCVLVGTLILMRVIGLEERLILLRGGYGNLTEGQLPNVFFVF